MLLNTNFASPAFGLKTCNITPRFETDPKTGDRVIKVDTDYHEVPKGQRDELLVVTDNGKKVPYGTWKAMSGIKSKD